MEINTVIQIMVMILMVLVTLQTLMHLFFQRGLGFYLDFSTHHFSDLFEKSFRFLKKESR